MKRRERHTQVDGHPDLVRDNRSKAIININHGEMTQARIRKKKWRDEQEKMAKMQNEISEMKELIKHLIEEKDGNQRNNG